MIKLTPKQLKTIKTFNKLEDMQVKELKANPELMREYIQAAFEDYNQNKNIAILKNALGVVVRAIGASKLSRKTKLDRSGLYKSFSAEGKPSMDTFFTLLDYTGVSLNAR